MAELEVIAWPYHAGLTDVSMGLGATVLVGDERFRAALADAGWGVRVTLVPPVDDTLPEIARTFELARRLALRVAAAHDRGAFPMVRWPATALAVWARRPPAREEAGAWCRVVRCAR